MGGFWAALQFLTIIPVPVVLRQEDLMRSVSYFPLVGYLVGLLLALIYGGLWPWLHPFTTAVVLVVADLILTGALHADGYMDTVDALAAGKGRQETLELFRGPHVGAKAVVGMGAFLLLRVALLAEVQPPWGGAVILFVPVLGRWVMALSVLVFPYARSGGLGSPLGAGRASPWPAAVTAFLLVLPGIYVLGASYLVALAAVSIFALAAGTYFTRRLGGLVGDLYGALAETSQLLALALFVVVQAVW